MSKKNTFHILLSHIILVSALLGGCTGTSKPSNFYMLHAAAQNPTAASNAAIGVGPVKLPEYLTRPQIVTRKTNYELNIAEFERWAGSLKQDITRVVAENISTLLNNDRVVIHPWRRSTLIDYQVEIIVLHFDGKLGKDATMKAHWAIFSNTGEKMHMRRVTQIKETPKDDSYNGLVAAWSRILLKLSTEIATEIKNLS